MTSALDSQEISGFCGCPEWFLNSKVGYTVTVHEIVSSSIFTKSESQFHHSAAAFLHTTYRRPISLLAMFRSVAVLLVALSLAEDGTCLVEDGTCEKKVPKRDSGVVLLQGVKKHGKTQGTVPSNKILFRCEPM